MWKMEINDLPRELKAKIIQGKDLTGNLNFHLWSIGYGPKRGPIIFFSILNWTARSRRGQKVGSESELRTVRMYVISTLISKNSMSFRIFILSALVCRIFKRFHVIVSQWYTISSTFNYLEHWCLKLTYSMVSIDISLTCRTFCIRFCISPMLLIRS